VLNTEDKTLVCSDCGQEFTFSASEQQFFAQKGFSQPVRCPLCRAARKAARNGGDATSYSSSGSSSYSGRSDRQMYPAVCATCGKQTMVPFEPRGDRPVYCSECYQKQRGSSGYGSGGSDYGGGSRGRSSGGGRSGGGSRY
jgi:CxxC-x17-CxxC domain-containing protein